MENWTLEGFVGVTANIIALDYGTGYLNRPQRILVAGPFTIRIGNSGFEGSGFRV